MRVVLGARVFHPVNALEGTTFGNVRRVESYQRRGREMSRSTGSRFVASLATLLCLVALGASGTASSASTADSEDVTANPEVSLEGGWAQEAFAAYLEALQAADEDALIDAAWHGDFGTVLVAPGYVSDARELARAYGAHVKVSSGKGIPLASRGEVESAAMSAVAKAHDLVFSTRYDPARNALVVTVYVEATPLRQGESQSIESSARSVTKGSGIAVVVETSTEETPVMQASQGGEPYTSGCTGGFMAFKGSAAGILTAAHCTTKPATYDGATTGTTSIATNYDFRFTALSGSALENKIRTGASTYNAITSSGTPVPGLAICKYGSNTKRTCGTVNQSFGCIYFGGTAYTCGLFNTTTVMSGPGDSGGPWYVGSRAYGIHYGATSTQSYFTGINTLSNFAGVYLKTT